MTRVRPVSFKADSYVTFEGTRPSKVYFIVKGKVENMTTERVLPKGAFFGEKEVLNGDSYRKESYLAKEDSYFLYYSSEDFLEILS